MKKLILFLLLTSSIILYSYDWSSAGIEEGIINNFCFLENSDYMEVICTSDGFYTYGVNGLVFHSYGLPVWDVCSDESGTGDIILIMGNGTYSDGIYSYTFDISEFSVLNWFVYPKFLMEHELSGYLYVGGQNGLMRSLNGIDWEAVPFFNGMDCHSMVIYEGNLVVSANDNEIFYSNDSGIDWYSAEVGLLITDMCFDSNGKLYGVFPDASWSSGLYSSDDFGLTWQIEFWDTMLNAVYVDLGNKVFVGWKDGVLNSGFAQWLPELEELYFYNYGLPNLNINKITSNPFIDCENLICCTDNGSYMLTDYDITSSQDDLPEVEDRLTVYPNPFNPTTSIFFSLTTESRENCEVNIYNIKGQKVKDLTELLTDQRTNQFSVIWNGVDETGKTVGAGVYFAVVEIEGKIYSMKLALMK